MHCRAVQSPGQTQLEPILTKVIALVLLAAMIAHLIKPLGLPGLKKRGDFWKIAIFAFVAMMFVVTIQF